MKFKDYLIDFGKWLLRILIGAALIFGPLMLAVEFVEPKLLLLYIVSAAIMTVFLISYFKKR
jgi:hypothetical protein